MFTSSRNISPSTGSKFRTSCKWSSSCKTRPKSSKNKDLHPQIWFTREWPHVGKAINHVVDTWAKLKTTCILPTWNRADKATIFHKFFLRSFRRLKRQILGDCNCPPGPPGRRGKRGRNGTKKWPDFVIFVTKFFTNSANSGHEFHLSGRSD